MRVNLMKSVCVSIVSFGLGKKMRAANFDEAKFSLNAPEQTIEIKLIY